jgi:NAD(P)-dependent dehydrogenase (short-subunit alcohol dehydrogenase family)
MNWTTVVSQKLLKGKNAVVTGASRGVGKGIALVLGEAGATVFITGRSKKNSATSDNMPGSTLRPAHKNKLFREFSKAHRRRRFVSDIDDTADEITERGGLGIPIYCDHSDESSVKEAFKNISGLPKISSFKSEL